MAATSPYVLQPLADIIQQDARAAAVFERRGLDYCCGGRRTLAEACQAAAIDPAVVVADLDLLGPPVAFGGDAPGTWGADELTRHIVSVHHRYVGEAVPQLEKWLNRLVDRHGAAHPELAAVRATFGALAADLKSHMAREEALLFPAIDDLARASRVAGDRPAPTFATVLHPIRMMEEDHLHARALLDRLRTLSAGYLAPPDGCATFRACYAELARFEANFHWHVHLENNVLFPKALALEQDLA
jgi:regulator of cell morphogenesis and NO signaling